MKIQSRLVRELRWRIKIKKSKYRKVVKIQKRQNQKSGSVPKKKASRDKNLGQSGLFFIANTKKTFTKLRQAFIEALILNHFDLECHIQIETDASSYVIGGIFSQLTFDYLSQ